MTPLSATLEEPPLSSVSNASQEEIDNFASESDAIIPDFALERSFEKLQSIGLDLEAPIPLRSIAKTKLTIMKLLLLQGDSHKIERDMIIENASQDQLMNLMAETYNRAHFAEAKDILCIKKVKYLNGVIRKVRHNLEETKAVTF